jgi:general secretion pathway protein F
MPTEWREFDAVSVEEGVRLAVRSGFRVSAIGEAPKPTSARSSGKFQLLLFTQELLALLDAGLNVVEALETLQRKETSAVTRLVLDQLIGGLHEGKSLSDVLTLFPDVFPTIYIAGVMASERTGMLTQTLARFVTYQLQLDAVRKKVVSSAIYPVLLIVVGTLVTIFLLGYVVPKFSVMLETTGNRASSASRLLLELGGLIGRHQTLVWGGLAALLALLAGVFGQKGMRARAVAWLAELPVIRKFSLTLSLARFYRTVALLLDAGIPLLKALEMSSSLLTPRGAAVLPGVREKVRTGLLLSAAMENTALLTPIAESLIKVGEKSGKLAEMMERIARFLDEELARQVDWFTRLFEPLLMTAIGLVIGMVVVLMYMPIFDLVESFQ